MATSLWLLRHGEAVPHGSKEDEERELTPRGAHESRTAGRALARMNIEFDACYTSPKVRARQTAALACEELGVEAHEVDVLGDGFERADAEDLLAGHRGGCVLVVGHEPSFSRVVHDFTGARIDFPKGGVAGVRIKGSKAELFALLRPAELETMAG